LKCEKDVINKENKQVVNVEGNSLENHEFLVSEIGVDKIQENMKLTKRLKKLGTPKQKTSNNRTLNKTIYSSEYDFTINADYAKYIESNDGNYHSYTFHVVRDVDNGLLENLLVTLDSEGGYKLFLAKYNITKQEKIKFLNGKHVDFRDKVNFISINADLLDQIFSRVAISCIDIYYTYCEQGNHSGGMSNGRACPAQRTSSRPWCENSGGGGTNGGNGGNGGTGGGGSGGNDSENESNHNEIGGGPNDENQNDEDFDNDPIQVTTPVVPPEDVIKNCLGDIVLNGETDVDIFGWLDNASLHQKKVVANYLNSNSGDNPLSDGDTNCNDPVALDFVVEAIEAMLENGEVDWANEVILDSTFVSNEKAKCTYDKLTADNSPLFRNTVGAFIDDPEFNLTFKVGNCIYSDDACTDAENSNDIIITIEDVNQSGLGIAALILHEAIHAEIHRFVAQFESGVDINDRPRVFQLYAFYKEWAENYENENYNWAEVAHHHYMVENYVNRIASVLRALDNNNYPLSHYMAYGWDGLTNYGYTSTRLTDAENTENQNLRAIADINSTFCN